MRSKFNLINHLLVFAGLADTVIKITIQPAPNANMLNHNTANKADTKSVLFNYDPCV